MNINDLIDMIKEPVKAKETVGADLVLSGQCDIIIGGGYYCVEVREET